MSETTNNLINFLQKNGVALVTAEEIARWFTHKHYERNAVVLRAGRISDEYIFLEEGFMRSFAIDTDGGDVTTNFYKSGQVVFEVSSFFHRTDTKENIQTLSDCSCWIINFQQLNELFPTIPAFREFGRSILVQGFTALKSRMLSTITESAETRYEALLQSNPEIFQHAHLKYIASYLGITDTSLSRIRKEYSRK